MERVSDELQYQDRIGRLKGDVLILVQVCMQAGTSTGCPDTPGHHYECNDLQ
jgi:hypothetical protein